MKTNKPLMITVIAFSIFASNAFALIKSPYPRQASPPDNNIVIVDDRYGWVQTTLRQVWRADMNSFKPKIQTQNPQEN
jgi:hypothetical protein